VGSCHRVTNSEQAHDIHRQGFAAQRQVLTTVAPGSPCKMRAPACSENVTRFPGQKFTQPEDSASPFWYDGGQSWRRADAAGR